MGPKHFSITHRQHGVVVYGANQTKPGISSIRPGSSLPTNAIDQIPNKMAQTY
jgi:hypothetical protein